MRSEGTNEAAPEAWGQLGPAMQALNEKQRAFVRHLVTGKPGHGALTRAYQLAGYKSAKRTTLSKEAHHLSRDARIIEAIAEEAKKVIRGVGFAEAVAAAMNGVRDPLSRDHARFVDMFISRADPVISKHSIDVTHRHEDPDRAALEELKALRQLGTARREAARALRPERPRPARSIGGGRELPSARPRRRSSTAKQLNMRPSHG